MNVACLIAGISLLTISCFGADSFQGWSYQYEVEAIGMRNESVHGELLYNGQELPKEFEHVITPIGEFVFVDGASLGSSQKIRWVPFGQRPGDSPGTANFARSQKDIKGFLNGEYPGFRRATSKAAISVGVAGNYEKGTLDNRPREAGSDWFYVIKPRWWVNPRKIDEALKALAGK